MTDCGEGKEEMMKVGDRKGYGHKCQIRLVCDNKFIAFDEKMYNLIRTICMEIILCKGY